jgi:hypothetical protein
MAVPWLGVVRPFTLNSASQFLPEPPPRLNSARYARAYREVLDLGRADSSVRTPEQTELANFFNDNFVVFWNRALRAIAEAYVGDIADSARLFALANLASADALITAWNTKNHYVFWRPLTAIQEGDHDGNRRTAGDPDWTPFLNTPNYPDYSSGANNITGAMTRTLALFFGTDEVAFSLTSANTQAVQPTRAYTRFSVAAQDVVDVRVYQGIHFRFADQVARRQGRLVARWAFKHFLRPVGRHETDDSNDDAENEDGDEDRGER